MAPYRFIGTMGAKMMKAKTGLSRHSGEYLVTSIIVHSKRAKRKCNRWKSQRCSSLAGLGTYKDQTRAKIRLDTQSAFIGLAPQ
ncbi:hypothetical protein [Pseudomonas phage PA26]|uniref:Uncharacterized protein n=1 Tax=Pseudomonas phage PA26 TaxID=1204542 RepID=I7DJQ6_9CAUD|nr:hypothetical protein FDH24_gp86 [Pseudomonas phage PA26]AFO70585.1 hypothetical protein [Pseudomonas phage PA26]